MNYLLLVQILQIYSSIRMGVYFIKNAYKCSYFKSFCFQYLVKNREEKRFIVENNL